MCVRNKKCHSSDKEAGRLMCGRVAMVLGITSPQKSRNLILRSAGIKILLPTLGLHVVVHIELHLYPPRKEVM